MRIEASDVEAVVFRWGPYAGWEARCAESPNLVCCAHDISAVRAAFKAKLRTRLGLPDSADLELVSRFELPPAIRAAVDSVSGYDSRTGAEQARLAEIRRAASAVLAWRSTNWADIQELLSLSDGELTWLRDQWRAARYGRLGVAHEQR